MNILKVKNLAVDFGKINVVSGVSFEVERGKIMALVGESGCGKSLSCLALTRLIPAPPAIFSGEIDFLHQGKNHQMLKISEREMRKLRGGGIAYVFQEPSSSLNPVFTVGDQIAEAVKIHRKEIKNVRAEVISLLTQVGIPAPESRLNAYPHELSGGMQQRVMIAMALACAPELLVADEPTTALDVTIQSQILELLDKIRKERNMAVILVTHNLGIVAELADFVTVMYAGNVVESASCRELFADPRHPYTRALLNAVPKLGGANERLTTIPGTVPSPGKFAAGCRFFGRCEICAALSENDQTRCSKIIPKNYQIKAGHTILCHYPPGEKKWEK